MTNTSTKTRIKYNFTLNFPDKPFTVKTLTSTGNHPKYITAYMRVKKALSAGEIVVTGLKDPKTKRRGAREKIYVRANATTVMVSETATVGEPF